ncbi:helix-turn-helix domain-containing protein [Butyrivibrio sp. MC2013]|uniref:helix-turn-helix domain-containing protein n=1 Tax=Butyrivibrio sp. MC2013 TaxID=1280686 RepID=UPI0004136F0D|nr:helix-turn-helix transcriptional regulator [Butyrivibrio sp. MC2013]
MEFKPDRLIKIREEMGINKAEAARRLNMSAMGYGRYEKGEREPSFQTVSFIADTFNTTVDYLCGINDDPTSKSITISSEEKPQLYALIESIKDDDSQIKRLMAYYNKITKQK